MAKAHGGVSVATEVQCPRCGGLAWQKDAANNNWICPTDGYTRPGTASMIEKGHG